MATGGSHRIGIHPQDRDAGEFGENFCLEALRAKPAVAKSFEAACRADRWARQSRSRNSGTPRGFLRGDA